MQVDCKMSVWGKYSLINTDKETYVLEQLKKGFHPEDIFAFFK